MKPPLSTPDMSLRHVERALDALARGEAVQLEDITFCAAQLPRAASKAVLSPERAAYLGVQPVVELGEDAPALIEALLHAPRLEAPVASRAATAQEALAVSLVKRAGFLPLALVVEAEADTLFVSEAEMRAYAQTPVTLTLETRAQLPTAYAEHTRVCVFTERGGAAHLALLVGAPEAEEAPLARLHSSCLTGDLLGSLRCDCGGQLHAALAGIAAAGSGVLLYLNQEGRGIGLAHKLRAYRLQEAGLDTVDANLALGFGEDERDFTVAAQMLSALGLTRIRLMTNNPEKIKALEAAGIAVTARLPLSMEAGVHNRGYLETKAARLGHMRFQV